MRAMELVLLSLRLQRHMGTSGYSRLCDFLSPARKVELAVNPGNAHWERAAAWFLKRRSETTWINYQGLRLQNAAVKLGKVLRPGSIFFFLYGERGFSRAAQRLRQSGHKVVATFHEPPESLVSIIKDRARLTYLDGIILLNSSQREFFTAAGLAADRLFVVPHGVDTEAYRPSAEPKNNTFTCLSVGTHLRNTELLASTCRAAQRYSKIRFDIVGWEVDRWRFQGLSNCTFHSNLTDHELLQLYSRAHVFLFLPKQCTANNALLEAMAFGLPIITLSVASIREYVPEKAGLFAMNSDADEIAGLLKYASEWQLMDACSKESRRQAKCLGWPIIACRLNDVFGEIVQNQPSREEIARG